MRHWLGVTVLMVGAHFSIGLGAGFGTNGGINLAAGQQAGDGKVHAGTEEAQGKTASEPSAVSTPSASTQSAPDRSSLGQSAPGQSTPGAGIYTTTTLGPLNSSDPSTDTNAMNDLLAVPPNPKGKVSLIGGTVRSIDRIKSRMTLQTFGGPKISVQLDERSHIFRNGVETTQLGINKGDRAYVDTMLDDTNARVFVKNVHINTHTAPADAYGQLVSYDGRSGNVVVTDELSGQPVKFKVSSSTIVRNQDRPSSAADLRPGSLVAVRFVPGEHHADAQEVDIKALPGSSFTFFGRITHVDLRRSVFAIDNQADNKNYEIGFEPSLLGSQKDEFTLGAEVTVSASFDGPQYTAHSISIRRRAVRAAEGTSSPGDSEEGGKGRDQLDPQGLKERPKR